MIKTYNFSDNSTALPLTKAQRVLRSLGDTSSYSPHFFDDGFPKGILHTDAQAVLNVLDDIVFERDELRAALAAAESGPLSDEAFDIVTSENQVLKAKLAALEQEANEEDALRERLSGLLTKSVNAIRGEPAELSLHSWHDLPELCNGLVEKLAESEKCLQDSIDCNLNKLLAMSDEQVTALTRLEGSNPEEVAALARKTMELAVANVNLNEYSRLYEAALKREFDLAQKLVALEKQQPIAWIYAWECEGELITDWMTTDNAEAHSLSNECHNIRPLFLAAGAAPVPRMTGAALASQEPVAEVLLVDGEKVIDASMAFFDSVELGAKLYRAAGAAPVSECGNCFEGKSDMDHDCPVCRPRSKAGAAPADEWRDAVLNTLADHGMDAPLTDTPREIVKKLTDMVATMARDPAINAGAAPAAKVPEEPRIDINDLSGMIAAVIKEQTP